MILYYSIKNHILVSWMGTAMMNRYVVDKRERRRGRVVGTLCREAVRNRLIWEAYTATWGHVISGPTLPPRAMSGFLTLPQMGLAVVSMATKDHTDDRGLSCHLRSCWCLRVKCCWCGHTWVGCAATCGHGDVWARATVMAHIWVCDPTTGKVCDAVHSPCYHWTSWGCLGSGVAPVGVFVSWGHVATGAILVWVACAATQGHGDICSRGWCSWVVIPWRP